MWAVVWLRVRSLAVIGAMLGYLPGADGMVPKCCFNIAYQDSNMVLCVYVERVILSPKDVCI